MNVDRKTKLSLNNDSFAADYPSEPDYLECTLVPRDTDLLACAPPAHLLRLFEVTEALPLAKAQSRRAQLIIDAYLEAVAQGWDKAAAGALIALSTL